MATYQLSRVTRKRSRKEKLWSTVSLLEGSLKSPPLVIVYSLLVISCES